jgi:coatomer subunit beta'
MFPEWDEYLRLEKDGGTMDDLKAEDIDEEPEEELVEEEDEEEDEAEEEGDAEEST